MRDEDRGPKAPERDRRGASRECGESARHPHEAGTVGEPDPRRARGEVEPPGERALSSDEAGPVEEPDRERARGEVEPQGEQALSSDEDLPVVARMVVEIRSDGSRTVARGALEDAQRNEQVAIRAEGASPLSLAASLTRALARAPFLSQALASAPYAAGRAAGRAVRSIRGLLSGETEER